MKTYDPLVFLAVFQEMLGPLLWILPLLALSTVVMLPLMAWQYVNVWTQPQVHREIWLSAFCRHQRSPDESAETGESINGVLALVDSASSDGAVAG